MKIALIGYGKMGKAIEEIAGQKGHSIVLKISSSNKGDLTPENIRKADVAIEFTRPESALANVMFCLENGVPVVCGTTGWIRDMNKVEETCKKKEGSFLYASNFSIGVNIFFELNRKLAELMHGRKEYDVSMQEIHHIHKKDAPSGTAISLAQDIIDRGLKSSFSIDDKGKDSLRIISIREDEVPGTHLINYFSENDQIEIIHTAHNRKGFASGAVAAAEYIQTRTGVFTMKDVLGI